MMFAQVEGRVKRAAFQALWDAGSIAASAGFKPPLFLLFLETL
jgi:hypothetical protein